MSVLKRCRSALKFLNENYQYGAWHHTEYDEILSKNTVIIHIHAADSAKVSCERIISDMKVRCSETGRFGPHTVVAETCDSVTVGIYPKLIHLNIQFNRVPVVAEATPLSENFCGISDCARVFKNCRRRRHFLLKTGDLE